MNILSEKNEVRMLALRAIAERKWRNGYLTRLAECAIDPMNDKIGYIGDYFDQSWLRDLADKEGLCLALYFFSEGRIQL